MIDKYYFIFGLTLGLILFYIRNKHKNIVYVTPKKNEQFLDDNNRCYQYLKKKI